jgi:antitoxin (DNA-binding transcriptional repressor) of toxin-antitoxin stability system
MEKSYGIEAARAQLGDIADHARITGEVIALTRHGRTVAVIGPAEAVHPVQGVEVTFLLPANQDAWARLPAVPRKGDVVRRENDRAEETWIVAGVEWYLNDDGGGMTFARLEPGDDYTRSVVSHWETDLKAKRK